MNDERIRQMMDDNYDEAREDTIRSMLSEFYSRKMAATAAFIWAIGVIFLALAVYSAVAFFRTDQTKYQILYATIFITCFYTVGLMKIFAWQMLHRNSIKREIKRLELRIAELASSGNRTTR
jgi:multisubunit Na+/H+ antiporter MnhG subunit